MKRVFLAVWLVPLLVTIAWVALAQAASVLQAPASSISSGGTLYDKWWKVVPGATEPKDDHPLWATQTTNTRKGSDTWRCKECHGWDYKGKDGAYGSGSHKTGFVGVIDASAKKSQEELVAILKGSINPKHDFSKVLDTGSINNLASFLKEGLVDMSQYIDYATKKPKSANASHGKVVYEGTCAACHGADGTKLNFGSEKEPEYVGTVANDNPWEFVHKVRAGQPGTAMPSAIVNGWTMGDVVDVLAHAQTLPTAKPGTEAKPPGTAEAGKAFWGKYTSLWCLSCHGVNGEGGYGPDLAGRGLSFEQFQRAVRRPWGVMPAYTEQQVSDQNIADLVAYFNSLPKVPEPGPWRTKVPAGAPLGQRLLIETAGCSQCHGGVVDGVRRLLGGRGADFAKFEELVYDHTKEYPTGRMGSYSKARLTEETLRTIWTYISQDFGLRVPVTAALTATAAPDGTVTYTLTLENTGQAGKSLTAGEIYISLLVPAGSSVASASSLGYQGVQRYAPAGTDVAVWLAPRLAAQDKLTYTMTVTGSGARGGSHAFVRWLSPTRWLTPAIAGDYTQTALVRP